MMFYDVLQGVSKKRYFSDFCLISGPEVGVFFSHVFWNKNFEPVSSSHSNNTHSECKLPKNTCLYELWGWIIIEMIFKVVLVKKTILRQCVPLKRACKPAPNNLYHLSTFCEINHQNTVHLLFNWFNELQSAKTPQLMLHYKSWTKIMSALAFFCVFRSLHNLNGYCLSG